MNFINYRKSFFSLTVVCVVTFGILAQEKPRPSGKVNKFGTIKYEKATQSPKPKPTPVKIIKANPLGSESNPRGPIKKPTPSPTPTTTPKPTPTPIFIPSPTPTTKPIPTPTPKEALNSIPRVRIVGANPWNKNTTEQEISLILKCGDANNNCLLLASFLISNAQNEFTKKFSEEQLRKFFEEYKPIQEPKGVGEICTLCDEKIRETEVAVSTTFLLDPDSTRTKKLMEQLGYLLSMKVVDNENKIVREPDLVGASKALKLSGNTTYYNLVMLEIAKSVVEKDK